MLEEFYSDHAALYRLHDPSIPGCVEIWRIVHKSASGDLALVLIDLALLRQEIGNQRRSESFLEPWQNKLAGELERTIAAQADVDASHLWLTTWIKPERRTDRRSRRYSVPVANLVGCWAIDLQGASGSIAGNRYASQIARAMAKRILNWESTRLNSWEDFVNAIPWLLWLEAYSQKVIHSEHTLRPIKKSRKANPYKPLG